MTAHDDQTDSALLAAMAQGDERALESFWHRHQKRVYGFALQRLGEPADAADVLNDVMLTAWHQAGRFEGRSRVTTWLLGIAHHRVLDRLRARGRQRWAPLEHAPEDIDSDPSHQAAQGSEYAAGLTACMRRLPPNQRDVVHLAFVEELSYPDVSRILDIPEGTVKTRMFHARKALKACLQRLGLFS